MPAAPVTDSDGRHVEFSSASRGSVVVGSTGLPSWPHAHGSPFHTVSPRIAAAASASRTRLDGISQWNTPGSRLPFFASSRRSNSWRITRKLDGAMPP